MSHARRVRQIEGSKIRSIIDEAPEDAINLCWGQPNFDTPEHVKRAAIDAIDDGAAATYTNNRGIEPLRAAIADFLDYDVTPRDVLVTAGTIEALHASLMAFVDPGDEVLLPDPCFLSYEPQVRMAGGHPVRVPLGPEDRLTPEAFSEAITGETAAAVINSPVNPTGAVQTAAEMRAFAEIADDRDIVLVSDEVYDRIVYDADHVSPAAYGDNVVVVNAVSKTFSMTGWRLGYVTAAPQHIESIRKIHQNVQICATAASQHAALAAFTGPTDPVDRMIESYRARRDVLLDGFAELGLDCRPPEGTFYAYPEIPDGFVEACAKRGVLVLDGEAFGSGGIGHARISYASNDRSSLREALAVMGDAMADLR